MHQFLGLITKTYCYSTIRFNLIYKILKLYMDESPQSGGFITPIIQVMGQGGGKNERRRGGRGGIWAEEVGRSSKNLEGLRCGVWGLGLAKCRLLRGRWQQWSWHQKICQQVQIKGKRCNIMRMGGGMMEFSRRPMMALKESQSMCSFFPQIFSRLICGCSGCFSSEIPQRGVLLHNTN